MSVLRSLIRVRRHNTETFILILGMYSMTIFGVTCNKKSGWQVYDPRFYGPLHSSLLSPRGSVSVILTSFNPPHSDEVHNVRAEFLKGRKLRTSAQLMRSRCTMQRQKRGTMLLPRG